MTDSIKDFFETLSSVLLRCWIACFILLAIWFFAALVMGDTIEKLHGPMFGLSRHEIDLVFYCGMGLLKLFAIVFFFLPWLSIRMVLRKTRPRSIQ